MLITDIKLWNIYFVPLCRHAKPEPKDKFVVVAAIDGNHFYAFMINSGIRDFIKKQPRLLNCEAKIFQPEHDFVLKHNSYIDCIELYSYEANEFENSRGQLIGNALIALLNAVHDCEALPRRDKNLVKESIPVPKKGDQRSRVFR